MSLLRLQLIPIGKFHSTSAALLSSVTGLRLIIDLIDEAVTERQRLIAMVRFKIVNPAVDFSLRRTLIAACCHHNLSILYVQD